MYKPYLRALYVRSILISFGANSVHVQMEFNLNIEEVLVKFHLHLQSDQEIGAE